MVLIIIFLIVLLGMCIYFCVGNISDAVNSKSQSKESTANANSTDFRNIFLTKCSIDFEKK